VVNIGEDVSQQSATRDVVRASQVVMHRFVPLLALTCLLGVLVGSPATAQEVDESGDRLAVDVAVGFDGVGRGSSWTPVTVSFRPDRPISGELRVQSTNDAFGSTSTTVVPLELVAGAPVALRTVVPPGRVGVTVLEGDEVIASPREQGATQRGLMLVGLLGRGPRPAGPAVTQLPPSTTARWVGVDTDWLDVPRALASLDLLVVEPDQWTTLDEDDRQEIWREVTTAGMTLVLTGQVDDTLLPQPVRMDAPPPDAIVVPAATTDGPEVGAVIVPAGLGRLVLTEADPNNDADVATWEVITSPRGVLDPLQDGESYDSQPFAAQDLLQSTGNVPEIPAIPFLALFLAGYLLAVGPLVSVVLRRRGRPELAWAAVPVVALVFAAGPLALGGSTEGGSTVTSQVLTWWVDGVGEQRVAAAWQTPTSGRVAATLDGTGWSATAWGGQISNAVVSRTDSATTTSGQLRGGEVAGVIGQRLVDAPAPFDVVATVGSGGITVAVTNRTDDTVEDAQLVIGNRRVDLDPIPAGDSVTVADDAGHLQRSRLLLEGFPAEADQFGVVRQAREDLPVVEEMVVEIGPDGTQTEFAQPVPMPGVPFGGPGQGAGLLPAALRLGTPGMVWVVAPDSSEGPPVAVDGAQAQEVSAMAAVGTRIRFDGPVDTAPPAALLTQVVRSVQGTGEWIGPGEVLGPNQVLRVQLPPIAPETAMAGFMQTFDGGVELWDATARTWRNMPRQFVDVAAAPIASAAGEVWIRMTGQVDGTGIALAPPGVVAGPSPEQGGARGELRPMPMPLETLPAVDPPLPSPAPVPAPTAEVGQ